MLRTNWILWFAVCLHGAWGVLLLYDPSAAFVTATHHLSAMLGGRYVAAVVLLVVSGLAALGLARNRKDSLLEVFLILPQQYFLLMSAWSALLAIEASTFADGVVRPRPFIAADQLPAVFTALFHTLALIFIYGPDVRRRIWTFWCR